MWVSGRQSWLVAGAIFLVSGALSAWTSARSVHGTDSRRIEETAPGTAVDPKDSAPCPADYVPHRGLCLPLGR